MNFYVLNHDYSELLVTLSYPNITQFECPSFHFCVNLHFPNKQPFFPFGNLVFNKALLFPSIFKLYRHKSQEKRKQKTRQNKTKQIYTMPFGDKCIEEKVNRKEEK